MFIVNGGIVSVSGIRKIKICAHSPADFDMYEWHKFALVYVGKFQRAVSVAKHPVMQYRRECWVDKECNFRCDVSEAWEERMNREFVVAAELACELCYRGSITLYGDEFMVFIHGDREDKRTRGVRCVGRLTLADLEKGGK